MAKTPLEKQLEKQMRQEKQLADRKRRDEQQAERKRAEQAHKEANRARASTIISSQKVIDGFRIMDKTSEEMLKCLLNCEIKNNNHVNFTNDVFPDYVQRSIELELEKLIQYGMISDLISFNHGGILSLLPPALSYFGDKEIALQNESEKTNMANAERTMSNKVFIVHGHDETAKIETARTLEKAGFEAIILHEQADGGLTIIEKIERYTDVDYAVVLYTECDIGRDKEKKVEDEKFRARQNVVFEHGYLMAKLGRKKVCALVKGDVETPGDLSGVVYTPMDSAGAWKYILFKNMEDAGLDVDLNKALK